jgi:hypothetical protein
MGEFRAAAPASTVGRMTNKRALAFRLLLAVTVLGGLAVAIGFAIAFSALSDGPDRTGYDILGAAVAALPYLASVVVATVMVGSIGGRVRFAIGGLALASGMVAGIAAGLVTLGSTLVRIEPRSQPVELNSLLLAVWGVGTQITPVAIVLVVGAVALAAATMITRRVTTGPASVTA